MAGLWKTFVARKPESTNEMKDREKPTPSSKNNPAAMMLFTFIVLFSDLY